MIYQTVISCCVHVQQARPIGVPAGTPRANDLNAQILPVLSKAANVPWSRRTSEAPSKPGKLKKPRIIRAGPHISPKHVMIVQVIGFAGVSMEGILAVSLTEAKALRQLCEGA